MSIVLRDAGYGKSEVRLVKVSRRTGRHDLLDLTVDVGLEGDFQAAYTEGDNAGLLATVNRDDPAYFGGIYRSINVGNGGTVML